MIIIKLRGGLGNQLFQYALGRHLAEINKVDLALDLSVYFNSIERADYTVRGYELGAFNISERQVIPPRIPLVTGKVAKRISNVLHKAKIALKYKKVEEKAFTFDPAVFNTKDGSYVNGYWHSEKYFIGVEKIIRKEFSFKTSLSKNIKTLAEKILSTNSVSIHIRRGDYLKNTWALETFHIMDVEYYQKGIFIIEEKTKIEHCFIFSDDEEWAKNNIRLPYPTTYVSGNKNYEDLQLMSLCKHNIIANSSFSWWGAWLNSNKEKTVIAPIKWFKDKTKDTKDLIPASWTRI